VNIPLRSTTADFILTFRPSTTDDRRPIELLVSGGSVLSFTSGCLLLVRADLIDGGGIELVCA
jgi:hypothetical protein